MLHSVPTRLLLAGALATLLWLPPVYPQTSNSGDLFNSNSAPPRAAPQTDNRCADWAKSYEQQRSRQVAAADAADKRNIEEMRQQLSGSLAQNPEIRTQLEKHLKDYIAQSALARQAERKQHECYQAYFARGCVGRPCIAYPAEKPEPQQPPFGPLAGRVTESGPLVGQVTEITRPQADILRARGDAIDWTPFFDALGKTQQQNIERSYWRGCVPLFAKPEAGFAVQVQGKYAVQRGSPAVKYASVEATPSGCTETAKAILMGVSVPLSLWPPRSQMDSVRDISLEYSLTFHGTSIMPGHLETVKADHGYFEMGGKLYHYQDPIEP